jgi:hypothetical protein
LKVAHRVDGVGSWLKLSRVGDIVTFDRPDPSVEQRARRKARLERIPNVNRMDAPKRIRLEVAEVGAESGARLPR